MTTLELERTGGGPISLTGVPIRWRITSGAHRILAEWGVELLVLLVVGILIPVVIALHYGAMGAPSADDWAYDLSVYRLAFHGHLYLFHWSRITLVGQLVMAVPLVWVFGEHASVLNAFTCFQGMLGLLAVCYLGRRLGLSRRAALFSASVLGLGPMWAALSTSFMTDVPAFAWTSIALAVAASDRTTGRLLTRRSAAALVIAAYAFTIRDEAGVAFAVIAACRLWSQGRPTVRRSLPWVLAVLGVGAAMTLFYIWRIGVSSGGGTSNAAAVPIYQWWDQQWLFPLAGLMMAPVALAIRPLATVRLAWRSFRLPLLGAWLLMPVGPVVVAVARNAHVLTSALPWSGKIAYLEPSFGDFYFSLADFGGLRAQPYVPSGVLALLTVTSVGSMLVCVSATVLGLGRWLRRPAAATPPSPRFYTARLLALMTLGECAIFVVLINMNLVTWDRYILRLIPYTGLLLLQVRRLTTPTGEKTFSSRAGVLALAGLAGLSGIAGIATDGFVGSEWTYSQQFAAAHPSIPKRDIYTVWTWSSTANGVMVNPFGPNELPSYTPCYEQLYNVPPPPGGLDYRRAGSWVAPETYVMVPNPDASGRDCGAAAPY